MILYFTDTQIIWTIIWTKAHNDKGFLWHNIHFLTEKVKKIPT